ncbi:auxin response factor 4-like [Ipomoea triloba]|uniref:auxin response factor 4-like n=1 Tax=Ipomoea triloba TaxID=35885 RepID=UPI00125D1EAF|nr:auxin response factor 4-like [Ipomoea triloba]
MEIDLNHAVSGGVEKKQKNNASFCNGECEKGGGGGCAYCCLSTSTSSSCSSSNASSSSSAPPSSIYMELWHACAGPLTSLPKKGNVVVYFPQGHLEQAATSASPFPPSFEMDLPTLALHPQIFCSVQDVQLLANKENDEVYTKLTLLPIPEPVGMNLEGKEHEDLGIDEDGGGGGGGAAPVKSTSHMFCKTLTASDTSTHGGFSVPRRAAEDCFPPLDYKEQRPSQELVAKDLHGVEWKFRHIYRGQPRRHLLTTGWSIFVSQKGLVSGDAVLFLRGEGGDLRLGIRRAARPRNGLPESIIKNQSSYSSVLSAVTNAVSCKSTFHVFYSLRASHADFIVPYQKYVKSINNRIPVGTRFKMRYDYDDSPERRFSGIVTGISDMDPYRWPGSKWRCLMVRWDDDVMSNHQERVSPWDIDSSVSLPPLNIQSSPRMKKLRASQPALPHESHFSDMEESVRSSKVLQGQENIGLISPLYGKINCHPEFEQQTVPRRDFMPAGIEKRKLGELFQTQPPAMYTGFLESNRFPKVLQGQEICSLRSLAGKKDMKFGSWAKPEQGCNVFQAYQSPKNNFYHLDSQGMRNNSFLPYNGIYRAGQNPVMFPHMNDYPRENHVLKPISIQNGKRREEGTIQNFTSEQIPLEKPSKLATPETLFKDEKSDPLSRTGGPCKLFGFSLTKEPSTVSSQGSSKRSCTKVHKQGSLVGRAIDLSRLNGYEDLLIELEKLFGMEGLLRDPNKGWRILYTDSENDMMVVGDDPWHEFCEVVSKIHIYTQEEVDKMSIGGISDDTQSCLEEAPPVTTDASKSSSVGLPNPNSSPTVSKI